MGAFVHLEGSSGDVALETGIGGNSDFPGSLHGTAHLALNVQVADAEPSAEVDISCPYCDGTGCRVCKNSGWIEIMGSGMVDPAVFGHVGIDPEAYTGLAFGMGIDRQVLLLTGLDDQRLLFENDMRMLGQIGEWR